MLIKNSKPECLWKNKLFLGEGTLWIPSLFSIFFVDIKKKKILIFNSKTKKKKILKIDKEVGFISHIKKNFFILGLKLFDLENNFSHNLRISFTLNFVLFSSDKE